MHTEIDKLSNHVIICDFGRIGVALAKALKDGGAPFVVLEQNERRVMEAREAGHLCSQGDVTQELALLGTGIHRARCLATVLPNNAANVFITLSARSLNRSIEIIARGDTISTEPELLHAGANKVVLPTHIGAERIAEMQLNRRVGRRPRVTARRKGRGAACRSLDLLTVARAFLGLRKRRETCSTSTFWASARNNRLVRP